MVSCARCLSPVPRGCRAGRSWHFHRCDRLLRVAFGGRCERRDFAVLLTLAIWAIYGLVFRVDWIRAKTGPLPRIVRRTIARFDWTESNLITYCDWTTALRFGDTSTRPRH